MPPCRFSTLPALPPAPLGSPPMLKISRAYLDACGYVDGVFEELLIKPTGSDGTALHHVIHAPNGVGKTTILALLFSIFEPDRRKFLRTEINRQHKIEHYFMP